MEGMPTIIEYPEIASEIHEMYLADQAMRKKILKNQGVIESEEDDKLDKNNTDKMKEIVNKIGWPTRSKVGEFNSGDAWVLVQHSDHDVDFQEVCLDLMKKESVNEVNIQNIAYLEDRVRVNRGKPQLYGTQFTVKNGKRVPQPIEDEVNVNERRGEIGLNSIEEYTRQMYEMYGEPEDYE